MRCCADDEGVVALRRRPAGGDVKSARAPFRRSVADLRREGVHILLGSNGVEPHEPHTGDELIASYPWHLALIEAGQLADLANTR